MNVIEIEIDRGNAPGVYGVNVLRAPVELAGKSSLSLDVAAILDRMGDIERSVVNSATPVRGSVVAAEKPLRDLGRSLFAALFAGDIITAYRASLGATQSNGQRLMVVLRLTEPELAALPWESLFDPLEDSYLCMREAVVRRVASTTPEPLAITGPIRILGLASSPRGLPALDVEAERDRLTEALADPIADGAIELTWIPEQQGTWSGLHRHLIKGPWHVLHFVGHGDYDRTTHEGSIVLTAENGRANLVPASKLRDLLNQAKPVPRLVVLNSCLSGESGQAALFSGTAAALVRSGISAVAAMQFAITDPAAIAFANGFYMSIAAGRGIDEAMTGGRMAILGIPNTLEWVTPVLYVRGDPGQRLFTIQPPDPEHWAADLYKRALGELRAGRYGGAATLFDELLAEHQEYRDARQLREQARRCLDLALRYGRAQAALGVGELQNAIGQLREIVAIDRGYRDAAQLLANAQRRQELDDRHERGLGAMQTRNWDAAIDEFETILRVDPGYRDVRPLMSVAVQQRNLADRYEWARVALRSWRWKKATRGFTQVLAVDPTYRDAARLRDTAGHRRRVAVAAAWTAVVGLLVAAVVVIIPKGSSAHMVVPPTGLPASTTPLPDETIVLARVVNEQVGLFLVDSATGNVVALDGTVADVYEPVVTPDRRTIVYDERTPGPNDRRTLHAIAVDGTGDRELFQPRIDGCKYMLRPAWNPIDQRHIALPCIDFGNVFSLRIVGLDGTVVRTLATGMWLDDASFSPDGKNVIYATGTTDQPVIYSIPADGSGPAVPLADGRSPMWSPDGNRIVFSREDTTSDGNKLWSIYIMDRDGANTQQLTSGPEQDMNPQWSPDGNTIVFLSNPTSADGDLLPWLISAQGDSRRPLVPGDDTPAGSQPAWARR